LVQLLVFFLAHHLSSRWLLPLERCPPDPHWSSLQIACCSSFFSSHAASLAIARVCFAAPRHNPYFPDSPARNKFDISLSCSFFAMLFRVKEKDTPLFPPIFPLFFLFCSRSIGCYFYYSPSVRLIFEVVNSLPFLSRIDFCPFFRGLGYQWLFFLLFPPLRLAFAFSSFALINRQMCFFNCSSFYLYFSSPTPRLGFIKLTLISSALFRTLLPSEVFVHYPFPLLPWPAPSFLFGGTQPRPLLATL